MTESSRVTSTDITAGDPVVVLPLGSWEQHGPHLPLDTDSVIISAVINAALAAVPTRERFVVAPVLPVTASDEHEGFAGGLSTGSEALAASLVAICRSATHWARGIVIVNGHGGNGDALRLAAVAMANESIRHSVWSLPGYAGGDMHAGRTETSLMMHIDPAAVRVERIPGEATPTADIDALRNSGVKGVSESGVLGRPELADAEHGRLVLGMYRDSLVTHMTRCADEWLNDRP